MPAEDASSGPASSAPLETRGDGAETKGRALYAAAQSLARVLVRAYYPSVVVVGGERVPGGPLVLAANHPNSLIDPVVLGAFFPRPVRWLAKAPLFDLPGVRALLDAFGVIPVHRRHEGGTKDTTALLVRTAADAVASGDVIGIFPEGLTHDRHRLAPLKTGVARIAVLAAQDAKAAVHVLPVALHFADKTRFRSEAVVALGKPLLVAASDEPEAVTARLKVELERLLAHVEDDEQEQLLLAVRRLEGHRLAEQAGADEPATRHRVDVGIAAAIRRFARDEPERLERFRRRLLAYLDQLERHGLSPRGLEQSWSMPFAVRAVAVATLLLPVALWGALHSWLPYRLSATLAQRRRPETDQTSLATWRLLWGLACFLPAWILEALLIASWLGPGWAVLFLVTAPVTALVSRWTFRVLRRQVGRVKDALVIGRAPAVARALQLERAWLVTEVERWREMHLRAGGDAGAAGATPG